MKTFLIGILSPWKYLINQDQSFVWGTDLRTYDNKPDLIYWFI
jgi:hypothetical protein